MSEYIDELGNHYGYCNACGEEALIDSECCIDGEIVQYDDGSSTQTQETSPTCTNTTPPGPAPTKRWERSNERPPARHNDA